jgi:uncharacterized protein (TIGR02118 family)
VVKLICFVKRKPGLSTDEFHRYWREQHGPLVARTRSGQHAVRYEQNHRAAADYGRPGRSDYDGVTEQWFGSLDDFDASLAEADFGEIMADMEQFIDTSALVWVMTEEPDVVVGP